MQLEVKLALAGSTAEPCAGCGQLFAHETGKPEIFLANSERFLCYDCAAKTDRELAQFAYRLEEYVGPSLDAVCPHCGSVDDETFHVANQAWAICRRHGTRFRIGSAQLLPPTTSIEQQQADRDFLARLIEVQPLEVPRLELEPREPEFQSILHQLEAMKTLAAKAEDWPLVGMTAHLKAEVVAVLRLYHDKFGLAELKILGVSGADYEGLEKATNE